MRRSEPKRLPRWLAALLLGLVLLRVGYHAAYLADDPFSIATFSDGRLYERAAFDLAASPPWGTEPFYLQGLYAYQLALPMAIHRWISASLLFQLVLAGLALWGLWRAAAAWRGKRVAGLSMLVVLSYPGLAFYENKYLTASLAVGTLVLMALAMARLVRRPGPGMGGLVLLGAATGLAVLARGNMLLAVPGVLVAGVLADRGAGRRRVATVGWITLGLALALVPMAVRNAVVTGRATVMPAHGGGTSFYIGNNRHARGVWNTGGGLLSGEVINERDELVAHFGLPRSTPAEEAAAVGNALYRQAAQEIVDEPGRWLWLELRKFWLLLGNDELSQDYDVAGERELLPWWANRGPPFGVLLALGLLGAVALRREGRRSAEQAAELLPWAWLLGAQVFAIVAANLLFFTSAQHRVPLVVPLGLLAGPGLAWLLGGFRADGAPTAPRTWLPVGIAVLLLAQAAWPRQRSYEPTAEHYYNLAIAYERLGQPHEALDAYDRAVERRPDHPVIRLQRATLHRERGHLARARADLEHLAKLPDLPVWVVRRARDERRRVAALQGLADGAHDRRAIPPAVSPGGQTP